MNRPSFNLSDWALKHRSLVWFLLIVSMVAGLISYRGLGREEDPNFTIKVMVISAAMPGNCQSPQSRMATARHHPAEARSIFTGKQLSVNPVAGSASRLWSFSMWQ
mgnify:CR=1 FL=1